MIGQSLLQPSQLPPLLGGGPDASAVIGSLYHPPQPSPDDSGPPVPGGPPGQYPPVARPIPSATPPIPTLPDPSMPPPLPQHPHQNLLGRVHDALMNSLVGGTEQGYDGLLTPQQIESTKPSLFSAIFPSERGMSAAQVRTEKLDHLVQLKQAGDAAQRQQQILKARNDFASQFPPPTSGTEAEMSTWANRAIPYFTAHGDTETVKSLIPLAEKFAETKAMKGNPFQAVQAGDAVYTFNPQTGTYVKGPERGIPQAKLDEDSQNRALRALALKQGYQEFQIKGAESAARAFANQNKSLTDASNLYTSAKAAIAEARAGNPAAMKSAILNFAASADAKAQLRMGTINFIKQIDPSFAGNLRASLSRILSGTLPPDQINMMEQLLDHIHADQAAAYEHRRTGVVGRNPLAEGYIPPTEEIFGSASAAPAVPPTGANKVRSLMSKP